MTDLDTYLKPSENNSDALSSETLTMLEPSTLIIHFILCFLLFISYVLVNIHLHLHTYT